MNIKCNLKIKNLIRYIELNKAKIINFKNLKK